MTTIQDRLFAGRAVRAAQAQEELARSLRPAPEIPSQRRRREGSAPKLSVVTPEPS
ncbi:MAG TPA: hypothetical protein VK204_12980 [Nocardioidaceae bacterium]|nr:hypothetical protein [Nocardioidaceae bacterium]